MENKFASLEAESVKKADTYLSIAKKTAIVKLLAPGCIEQVDVLPKSENANVQPIPPRWQENILGKRLIMSYVLAGIYLHLIDVNGLYNSETPKFEFTARQYDIFSTTDHITVIYILSHKIERLMNEFHIFFRNLRKIWCKFFQSFFGILS